MNRKPVLVEFIYNCSYLGDTAIVNNLNNKKTEQIPRDITIHEGAEILSSIIQQVSCECAYEIGKYRSEKERKSDFDDTKFITIVILFQCLFLYLTRRAGKNILGDFKDSMFFGALFRLTARKCEQTVPDFAGHLDKRRFKETYRYEYEKNEELFLKCKLPSESDYKLEGTLYWEFAEHISHFVGGTLHNIEYLTLVADLVKASLIRLKIKHLLQNIQ